MYKLPGAEELVGDPTVQSEIDGCGPESYLLPLVWPRVQWATGRVAARWRHRRVGRRGPIREAADMCVATCGGVGRSTPPEKNSHLEGDLAHEESIEAVRAV